MNAVDSSQILTSLPLYPGSPIYMAAERIYAETPRGYHAFSHAIDVLERVDRVQEEVGFVDLGAVRLAALFHDAVYTAGDPSNEAVSAVRMSFSVYDHYPAARSYQIVSAASRLIEATAKHMAPQNYFTDWDTRLFLDCDLLGFAEFGVRFDKQQDKIEEEFRYALGTLFDPKAYTEGRRKFLTALRAKGVYRSPYGRAVYEATAQANIARALSQLEAAP
jgi:predicted metal-dependent HD superfamily phosphohydrolase